MGDNQEERMKINVKIPQNVVFWGIFNCGIL